MWNTQSARKNLPLDGQIDRKGIFQVQYKDKLGQQHLWHNVNDHENESLLVYNL